MIVINIQCDNYNYDISLNGYNIVNSYQNDKESRPEYTLVCAHTFEQMFPLF